MLYLDGKEDGKGFILFFFCERGDFDLNLRLLQHIRHGETSKFFVLCAIWGRNCR